MFCQNCGKNVLDGSKFCDGCGASMTEQAAPVYAPAAKEGYSQNNYYNPQPAYTPASEYIPNSSQSQQGYYQPTSFAQKSQSSNDEPLSIGNYIVMMLVTAIPIVGFIMLLVWSFGGNVNRNKKNWALATLIMGVILFVLMLLFSSVIGAMMARMF
ncbi:MAG: zinc-ribbon domain-containing protein [Clostridia bacterium]